MTGPTASYRMSHPMWFDKAHHFHENPHLLARLFTYPCASLCPIFSKKSCQPY